jgi:uncharacterized membrane protein
MAMKTVFLFVDRLSRSVRLLLSAALGILVFLLVQKPGATGVAFLYAWICFAGSSLFFSWVTMFVQHPKQTARIAREQDESWLAVFLIVVSAAFISLFAVLVLLNNQPTSGKIGLSLHIVLSLIAITLSWLLIHSVFAIRYAHLYYDRCQNALTENEFAGGLVFPGNELPDFLDFAYFSFVLAMTFQTADVNISSRRIRRLALVHGLLSFVYNTTIIALIINIISGLIGSR